MRAARLGLVSIVGMAVFGAGLFPSEHLHHATASRSQVVHSHLELLQTSPAHHGSLLVDDDDHDAVVSLDLVIAPGPRIASAGQPAVAPTSFALTERTPVRALVSAWEPRETPSPPPSHTPSRAPPA